jgi:NADPH:quinone reductase-like Zn-dependent oxidoreductase
VTSTRNSDRMFAIRLHLPGTLDDLVLDQVEMPRAGSGEALVRVHAAAITRDELDWPVDRLPAIPSYELSGTIAAIASDVSDLAVGERVWALTGFDRDGAAAEYTLVPATVLAPKPRTLGHVESAAIPLAGLTAWQGLFEHGRLREGERVLIHGAAGGVGQFATQLAHGRGAYVIGTSSSAAAEEVLTLGADEAFDRTDVGFEEAVTPVDLVFDTVGGEALARSAGLLREDARIVSVAEEPPTEVGERVEASYFVVEPSRDQLLELARGRPGHGSSAGRLRLPARRGARCVRARHDARQARQGRVPDRR